MITRGFMDVPTHSDKDQWWFHKSIQEIQGHLKPITDYLIDEKTTISEAIKILNSKSIDVLLNFQDG